MLPMSPFASSGSLTEQPLPTDLKSTPLSVSDRPSVPLLSWAFDLLRLYTCGSVNSLLVFLVAYKGGAQEITVRGSESRYCFDNLTPDTLYNATVYAQTPNLEGPGVSIKERTCKNFCLEISDFVSLYCSDSF